MKLTESVILDRPLVYEDLSFLLSYGEKEGDIRKILNDILSVDAGANDYILKKINMNILTIKLKENIDRTKVPLFLNPSTASFMDVCFHAKVRQYLSDGTILKNIGYAQFMENHKCPVDFRNLTPENILKHFDYRIQFEDATPDALAHERKAVMMFLRAYGVIKSKEEMRLWSQVLKTPPRFNNDDNVYFLYPFDAHKFYTYEGFVDYKNYNKRVYTNKLLQHISFFAINFGVRCPSEIINMAVSDVVVKEDGNGYILVTEDKKHEKVRKVMPHNKTVLSSLRYKSPFNYLMNWRFKVFNDLSGDALFLQYNGKPVTSSFLRIISKAGKKITGDDDFSIYSFRHTFGTYYYQMTKDLIKTSRMLGHTKTRNTEKYVSLCDDLSEQYKGQNLFNLSLKPQNRKDAGEKVKGEDLNKSKKDAQIKVITPVDMDGLGRI